MVRILETKPYTDSLALVKYAGLSTDTMPTTGLVTGSTFLCVDTGDVYAFNEEAESGSEWALITSGDGGNDENVGNGGNDDVLLS